MRQGVGGENASPAAELIALERIPIGSNRMRSSFIDWRMSFSENRFPLFRDMR